MSFVLKSMKIKDLDRDFSYDLIHLSNAQRDILMRWLVENDRKGFEWYSEYLNKFLIFTGFEWKITEDSSVYAIDAVDLFV